MLHQNLTEQICILCFPGYDDHWWFTVQERVRCAACWQSWCHLKQAFASECLGLCYYQGKIGRIDYPGLFKLPRLSVKSLRHLFVLQFQKALTLQGHEDWVRGVEWAAKGKSFYLNRSCQWNGLVKNRICTIFHEMLMKQVSDVCFCSNEHGAIRLMKQSRGKKQPSKQIFLH